MAVDEPQPVAEGAGQPGASQRSPALPSLSAVGSAVVLGMGTVITHGFGLSLVPAMLPRISREAIKNVRALVAELREKFEKTRAKSA